MFKLYIFINQIVLFNFPVTVYYIITLKLNCALVNLKA